MEENIFESSVMAVLNEEFGQDGRFYVYHGTQSGADKGLQNTGFERSWTNSNGGNMYGKGVYSTFSFGGGNNARGGYGRIIIKALVKSLNNYIIYNEKIAKAVYGEFNVPKQILKVFGKSFFDELKTTDKVCYAPNGYAVRVTFDRVVNSGNRDKSSESALALVSFIKDVHPEMEYQANGYIFCGNHDDDVCFIKDFKNVYPVEISYDYGKNFQPITASDNFDRFAREDVDLHFQLGKHNYKLMRELDEFPNYFINNFARVKKAGKYNFLYRGRSLKLGVISPVWFDEAPETFSKRGTAIVTIGNDAYILKNNNGEFHVYDGDGDYLCKLDDFQNYLNRSFSADDFDEEF